MAKFLTATLAIIVTVVIGVFLVQQMNDAAAQQHQQEVAAQQKADREAAARAEQEAVAKAARLKVATGALDAAMKDGKAGIAGTVVTNLRNDKSQIDAVIAALRHQADMAAAPLPSALHK